MSACIDFHSHILPSVDDGSKSVKESLEMLRLEALQGIRQVIATPHFYPNHDTPERFLRRRTAAWEKLSQAMEGRTELPEVKLGAEVYYFAGMSDSEVLANLTISGSSYLLLEMPHTAWTESMYREMEAIYTKRGIIPIVAHLDRYLSPFRTEGILRRLEELPVLVQVNADFFQGGSARTAIRMLKQERIHLLGSDCHNLTDRKPNMEVALQIVEKRLGKTALEHIARCQQEVLENT